MLAGNPNVGKSVIFGRLTGSYAEVANFPGTTVEVSRGRWQGWEIWDSPGVYGLHQSGPEEELAERVIVQADIIVNVIDSTRLRRDLYLTLQLLSLGIPLLVVANMLDEAEAGGSVPDLAGLAQELGVPVVAAAAVRNKGMAELERALAIAGSCTRPCRQGRICRDQDLRRQANAIYQRVAGQQGERGLGPLDRVLVRPLPGLVVAVTVLAAIWWVLGSLVAGTVVGFTEGVLMNRWLVPLLVAVAQGVLPPGLLLRLVAGELGLVPMVLGYGLGLLLPLVFSFYLLLALLEDTGYLPRLAVLLDNTFRPVGLNGRAVIPLLLGFGCVTMAVVSTRILSSRRERLILLALLALAVPCSAQTGVIAMLLVPMGPAWVALYTGIILVVFLAAGVALNLALPGHPRGLFLELPRLRLPRPENVLAKSTGKAVAFLREALPLFALGGALVTTMEYFGLLAGLEGVVAPLTAGWLRLPPEVVGAFLMGIIRRDFGAAGLYSLGLPPAQQFVALVTLTLFVPCLATVLVAAKEQGVLVAVGVWAMSLLVAVAVGGVVALFVL